MELKVLRELHRRTDEAHRSPNGTAWGRAVTEVFLCEHAVPHADRPFRRRVGPCPRRRPRTDQPAVEGADGAQSQGGLERGSTKSISALRQPGGRGQPATSRAWRCCSRALPETVPGTTINRLCASGLDAVGSAARAIRSGEIAFAIAGGVEKA